jgi:ATP-dependent DNA ligase
MQAQSNEPPSFLTAEYVEKLKPTFKTATYLNEIPIRDAVISAKADGEWTILYIQGNLVWAMNRYGTLRKWRIKPIPLVQEAILQSETYAVNGSQMMMLPDCEHILKSGSPEQVASQIRQGLIDVVEINGKAVNEPYAWRIQELNNIFKDEFMQPLPFTQISTLEEAQAFWDRWVVARNFEGVVIRQQNGDLWKVKPYQEIDAVIIGINKKERIALQEVTSLKLALMDEEGCFVEVGDVASGIDVQLRKALWRLMDFKIDEDKDTYYIKPFIVIQVGFTETFPAEKRVYRLTPTGYALVGIRQFVSLRHPRLMRFRKDKTVNPKDLRLSQIKGFE